MMHSPAEIAALIVLASFVSEDAAALGAASLAAARALDPRVAFLAACAGIWVGDLGLYALGRPLRTLATRWAWAERWLSRAEDRIASHSPSWVGVLLASRFIPGTRLPLYTAAGLTRFSFARFAMLTASAVVVWVALLFIYAQQLTASAPAHALGDYRLALAPVLFIAMSCLLRAGWKWYGTAMKLRMRRWARWEFWPAWLFYPPVALMCVWHAVRFGGFALPTIANPGQRNGGIIGESKFELLQALSVAAPQFTPPSALIDAQGYRQRIAQFEQAMECLGFSFPVVLKPDMGQRGQGFKKIEDRFQAYAYLTAVPAPVVLQAYVDGEHEVGIFYYRFPGEERGRIFAITEKQFPFVVGDGSRTVRELIASDPRAALIAGTYLDRFAAIADQRLAWGEKLRLVEAGNHCQGCIFKDGEHLRTPALEAAIDAIARAVPGFFIGRFDVRYSSAEELAQGCGFAIIELNGASSEATHIYDERNSLARAYATLYRQWQLVYAIGAANQRLAHVPAEAFEVLKDWFRFRAMARHYPAAD